MFWWPGVMGLWLSHLISLIKHQCLSSPVRETSMSRSSVDKPLAATHLVGRKNRVFIQTKNGIGDDDVVGVKTTAHRLKVGRR